MLAYSQIISHVLRTGKSELLDEITVSCDYDREISFIREHELTYNKVPDIETFFNRFPDFNFVDVREPKSFLRKSVRSQVRYDILTKVLLTAETLLVKDPDLAIDYIKDALNDVKRKEYHTDIAQDAVKRLERSKTRAEDYFIKTGIKGLDEVISGWGREEFAVVVARTGVGKTWFLMRALTEAWLSGHRVGLFSPEMSEDEIGSRFDVCVSGQSATLLYEGRVDAFMEHAEFASEERGFYVAGSKVFSNCTVGALKAWASSLDIDILAIDGLSYVRDVRAPKDALRIQLANISEDLVLASRELGIPVIACVQANREAARFGVPRVEHIRESDAIAQCATKIIALGTFDDVMKISVLKNRNARDRISLTYKFHPDKGEFEYLSEVAFDA